MGSCFSVFLLSYLIPLVLMVFVQDHEPVVVVGNQMANLVPFHEVPGLWLVVVVLTWLVFQPLWVVELGDQIPNLVPLAWTQAWFVVVTVFFVVPVRFPMRKRMMNWMNPRRCREYRVRVPLLLVPLELGNQMPNLVPLGVVWRLPRYPLVVVHQLACGWQFFLRQL